MSRRVPVFLLFLPSKHGDFNFLGLSLFRFRQTLVNRPQNPANHSADDETDNKFGAVEKHINHFVKRIKTVNCEHLLVQPTPNFHSCLESKTLNLMFVTAVCVLFLVILSQSLPLEKGNVGFEKEH